MELLSFAIVGAVVALIVQGIKKLADTSGFKTVGLAILVSLSAAACYYFLQPTSYWEHFIKILALVETIYAVLIKQLEKPTA